MPRVIVIDSYYPQFLNSWTFGNASYEEELQELLHHSFGTFDAVSRNLRALGWEAQDVIANSSILQTRWADQHWPEYNPKLQLPGNVSATFAAILSEQIRQFQPDTIFLQDLSIQLPENHGALVAGQCSCPWPGDDNIRKCQIVFTSFPHYVERIERLGVRAVYLPLAFDPIVLERSLCQRERIYGPVFVGGLGRHWKRGQEVLETMADEFHNFLWWGYGAETLPKESILREKYRGAAFGVDMYKILLQSKIVINRHGEAAEDYSNNLRMFEATGCGALLLTERSRNLSQFFSADEAIGYGSTNELIWEVRRYLKDNARREAIAANAQTRTLRDHTYAQRMNTVSDVLLSMKCPA